MHSIYMDTRWAAARLAALQRDGNRCTVGRLLGGLCHDRLDVHHIIPADLCADPYDVDNLLTVCCRHHPMVASIRAQILRKRGLAKCRHRHPYRSGREACLRQRLRQASLV